MSLQRMLEKSNFSNFSDYVLFGDEMMFHSNGVSTGILFIILLLNICWGDIIGGGLLVFDGIENWLAYLDFVQKTITNVCQIIIRLL